MAVIDSTSGAAATTADTANRRRDRRRVEAKLKLPEAGDEVTTFSDERTGKVIAVGYVRVVYGDHGAYVECRPDQVRWEHFEPRNLTAEYYDLYRAIPPGRAQVYLQKRGVQNRPNPPQGRDSKKHDRAEGYADYQPGLVYISVKQVSVMREGATAPRTYNPPAKGKPHCDLLKAALKQIPGVTVLDTLVRETRVLKDGKHRRFTRVPAEVLGSAAGVAPDACLKTALWLAAEDGGRPAAITLVPRSATVDVGALEGFCRRQGLRLASDRQLEALTKVHINEVMLPLHPGLEGCPTLICTEVMQHPLVAFHALCGVVATAPPSALLQRVHNASLLDIAQKPTPGSTPAPARTESTTLRHRLASCSSAMGLLVARLC